MGKKTTGLVLAVSMLGVMVYGVVMTLQGWFPGIASEHGVGVQRMLNYTVVATGSFFVIGHLALAYLIFSSSRNEGPVARRIAGKKELKMALLPALLMALVAEGGVLVLGLPVWSQYYGPPPADAIEIEVTGQQFRWIVRYPGDDGEFGRTDPELIKGMNYPGLDATDAAAGDDTVSVGEMFVPHGRPVKITLRSTDVIHSLFLPEFRVKQDAMPGMDIVVWFTPTKRGQFEMACNQICGMGHYQMGGFLHVVDDAEYEEWLADLGPFVEEL